MSILTPISNTEFYRGITTGTWDPKTPFGRTVCAILSDGSIFLACWFEDNVGTSKGWVRCWTLSYSTFAVLGTVDLPVDSVPGITGSGQSLFGWKVTNADKIVIRMPLTGSQEAIWYVDASSGTPSLISAALLGGTYNSVGEQTDITRLADGRVVVQSYGGIEVWADNVLQGANYSASIVQSDGLAWVDPANLNHLGVLNQLQPPFMGYTLDWFEVDITNPAAMVDSAQKGSGVQVPSYHYTSPYTYDYQDFVIGITSPYRSNFLAFTESYPPGGGPPLPGSSVMRMLDMATGSPVGNSVDMGRNFVNIAGPNFWLFGDLVGCFTEWGNTDVGSPADHGARFVAVDPTGATPVIEVQDLPYPTGLVKSVTLNAGSMSVGYDFTTGKIVAATCLVHENAQDFYSIVLYTLQGPSAAPDLSAKLDESRVRFAAAS